jgi:hypothetical protein
MNPIYSLQVRDLAQIEWSTSMPWDELTSVEESVFYTNSKWANVCGEQVQCWFFYSVHPAL